MSRVTFESVKPGDELLPITRPVNQDAFWRYAVASLDYNPLHTDPEWVKTAQPFKVPYTVAHGMMTMSFMATVVTDWAYPSGLKLTKVSAKFTKPVAPGWTIKCTGTVTEKHVICPGKNYAIVETKAVNQDGEMVAFGEARVLFPD